MFFGHFLLKSPLLLTFNPFLGFAILYMLWWGVLVDILFLDV